MRIFSYWLLPPPTLTDSTVGDMIELLLASDRRRDEEDSLRFLLSLSSTFRPGTLPGIFLEIEKQTNILLNLLE